MNLALLRILQLLGILSQQRAELLILQSFSNGVDFLTHGTEVLTISGISSQFPGR
jgi:hypothetical protein